MKLKIKKEEIKLTKYQSKMVDIFLDAYDRVYLWKKGNKVRVLNPKEIIEISGKVS